MSASLQPIFRFLLILGVTVGVAFMVACTVFVIVCIIIGDIKINIVRDSAEKESK